MRNEVRTLGFVVCLMLVASIADSAQTTTPSTPDYQFTAGSGSAVTPFRLYDNLILIGVSVNGSKPLPFALDSGSDRTVIDQSAANALGLTPSDIGESSEAGPTAGDVNLSWTGFEWLDRTAELADLSGLAPVLGIHIDGILGADLFEQFVVAVCYGKSTVSIYDPSSYQYTGAGAQVTVHLRAHLPVISASLGAAPHSAPVKLEIDTGSVDALTLNGTFARSFKAADAASRTIAAPAEERGELPRTYVRLPVVRIERFAVDDPIAAYCQADTIAGADGSIGGPFLSRFTVIFNYTHKTIIFEPNQPLGSTGRPFLFDASGLVLTASGVDLDTYRVAAVLPGSPAEAAGLEGGDVLGAIDGKPTSAMTLDNLRRLLQPAGRKYDLQYFRGGKPAVVTLTLRKLL